MVERIGIGSPLSVESLDRDRDASLAYLDRLYRNAGGLGAREAE